MNTTINTMRKKHWIMYTACFYWPNRVTSPLVIPYKTIDGVLTKFKEMGGSSYTLENNYLRGAHIPDDKEWVLVITSHYTVEDEGKYEEDQ
jgi:hypothetical protein